ncbi:MULTISPECIES: recombinase family protein [Vibrio]|uniref:recombinase family protein n=1 Tax=Vibrio TaxID=662 RepID=UPI000C818EB6|nr:recombinase family protein [Vibrio splendidus]PMG55968.1 hypothetical protein BCU89_12830 [Vibrio splendidus]
MTPKVYPYHRYSTKNQRKGTSIKRQRAFAEKVATQLNLTLGDSFIDDGQSGFHGKNSEDGGALFDFIAKAKSGAIPRGSVLAVESWDRFSRQDFRKPLKRLLDLLDEDIKVAVGTGSEYQLFEKQADNDADAEFMGFSTLLVAQMEMFRAWSESKRKSEMQIKSYYHTIDNHNSTGQTVRKIPGHYPKWIVSDKNGFQLHEDSKYLEQAIELYLSGMSYEDIAGKLKGKPCFWTNGWNAPALRKAFISPQLHGDRPVEVQGETKTAKEYFPALITKDKFNELQRAIERRKGHQGQQTFVSIVTGGGWLFCGFCGSPMSGQTQSFRESSRYTGIKLGDHTFDYSKVKCGSKKSDCICGMSHTTTIEKILLEFCADKANMSFLESSNSYDSEIIQVKNEIEQCSLRLTNLSNAIADFGYTTETQAVFKATTKQKSELEEKLAGYLSLEQKQTQVTGDTLERMLTLYDENTDESRQTISEILSSTIKKCSLITWKTRDSSLYETKINKFGKNKGKRTKEIKLERVREYPLCMELTTDARLPIKGEVCVVLEFVSGAKRLVYADDKGNWTMCYDGGLDRYYTRIDDKIIRT